MSLSGLFTDNNLDDGDEGMTMGTTLAKRVDTPTPHEAAKQNKAAQRQGKSQPLRFWGAASGKGDTTEEELDDMPTLNAEQSLAAPSRSNSPCRISKWNEFAYNEPVPQKYSWTGRSKYAAAVVMVNRLPLHPSIGEQFVQDDVSLWSTFNVPP